MKIPNPAKAFREAKAVAKAESDRRQESVDLFKERLQAAFSPRNREARATFVAALKARGIQPVDLMRLAQECAQDREVLIKWERKIGQEGKALNLSQVENRSVFSKILILVRELHAPDISKDISFDEASHILIDEILLHP